MNEETKPRKRTTDQSRNSITKATIENLTSSKEINSNLTKIASLMKMRRLSKNNNSSLIGNNNKFSFGNNLVEKSYKQSSFSNLIINNIPTSKNKNLFLNSEFSNSSLKYRIPKDNRVKGNNKVSNFSNFKNLGNALKLSNSMKSFKNFEGTKFRTVSYSPKNKNNSLKISTIENLKSKLVIRPSTKYRKEKNEVKNIAYKSNMNIYNFSTNQSCENQEKLLTAPDLQNLHLYENINTVDSNQTTSTSEGSFIFNMFYSKLMELKILNVEKSAQSPLTKPYEKFALYEYLIKIFDSISINFDNKFKKISHMLELLYNNDKDNEKVNQSQSQINNTEMVNIMNKLKSEISRKDVEISDLKNENKKLLTKLENIKQSLTNIHKKFQNNKTTLLSFKEENKTLKSCIGEYNTQIEILKKKEWKMMELMYVLKKKGIPIEEIFKENFNNSEVNHNNISESASENSSTTVYFPDKVFIKNKKDDANFPEIPKLDFRTVQSYESSDENSDNKVSDNDNLYYEKYETDPLDVETMNNSKSRNSFNIYPSEKTHQYHNENFNIQKNINDKINNFKGGSNAKYIDINKIQHDAFADYNSEFLEKYGEFSESWRKEIKQLKPLYQSLKKGNNNI